MLYLFILHSVITLVCYLSGVLFYTIISNREERDHRPVVFYLISGLILLTMGAQLWVLFAPLSGINALILMSIVLLLWALTDRRKSQTLNRFHHCIKALSIAQWVCIGGAWLMILLFNAGPTRMDDTDSYHIQMIKWIQEYGTVPGIANLHERFGFNSSWFSSSALFLFAGKNTLSFTALNGVVSLWLCIYIISRIGTHRQTSLKGLLPWSIIFVLTLACWPMIRGNPATTNYDFITTLVILVLFVQQFQASPHTRFHAEMLIWPIYLCTVRVINYPLLLLTIYSLIQLLTHKEGKKLLVFSFLSLALVIPFISRNIIVSGYPFFPAPYFDFLTVDWKADKQMMVRLNEFIKYFNRVNVHYLPIETTRSLNFPDWTLSWYKYLFTYDKPILISGVSGIILTGVFHRRMLKPAGTIGYLFFFTFILQLLSWFFIAPDPRFVYGILLCGLFLLLLLMIKVIPVIVPTAFSPKYILWFFSLFLLSYTGIKMLRSSELRNPIKPIALPIPPVKVYKTNGIDLNIPEKLPFNWNPRCYGTDLPCLYEIDPKLEARGNSISDGFRLAK